MLRRCVLSALALVTVGVASAASSYDETMAKDALVYASASYCPVANVANWSMVNSGCQSRTSSFLVKGTFDATTGSGSMSHAFAFVGVDTARQWIVGAFKGSNETADFITDLEGGEFTFKDCTINDVNFGKVHNGFCKYYQDLVAMGITDTFKSVLAEYPSFSTVITGHSLGAAAALLAARDVYEQTGVQPTLYTYGLPRTGDYDFAAAVADSTASAHRVVHASDIIAHLPMCCAVVGGCKKWSACPYHSATQVWYNNDMTDSDYTVCDGSGEDSSCANLVNMSIEDHLTYFDMEIGDYCCF